MLRRVGNGGPGAKGEAAGQRRAQAEKAAPPYRRGEPASIGENNFVA